ncbi:CapA family protein [Treponema sp. OMZ 857]|uniref:CapA family protein n=1 Tax=Treponema sp. OMZ 857 TaxID=1643513 RepID=UPI0020A5B0A0|nr:CapA family protein [Treponema sp. OMZ 857]UTC43825.1 CapA family protein [Treponema sp. OMZ 857]
MRRLAAFIFPILFSCCVIAASLQVDDSQTGQNDTELSANNNTCSSRNSSHTPSLVMTFAGDLMAHNVNFNMSMYDLIYKDVEKILHNDDLSFVNIETPVCDTLPLSTYPNFNVHTSYLRAAVQAGFDVLSFANNHTNDHGRTGIDGTLAAVRTVQKERLTAGMLPPFLIFSGLKDSENDRIQVTPFFYKGWNILFCSVTEILNSYDSSKNRLYYSAPTKQGREALLSAIKEARNRYPCDLFILGLHLNEPEYGRTVSEAKKAWFKQLGEAGIDIVWAHHPHVMQSWETIRVERPLVLQEAVISEQCQIFCMYSMGNFISGQRWHTRYDDPAFYREYTGDAVLLQLTCTRNEAGRADFSVSPLLITQYNEPAYPVVKRFTQEWIDTLNEKEKKYFTKRLELMQGYLPINISNE